MIKNVLTLVLMMVLATALFAGDAVTKTVDVKIEGMTCNGCVNKVKTALDKVEGVTKADVILASNSATVTFVDNKTSETKIADAINATGFKVVKADAQSAESKVKGKDCCGGSGSCGSAKKTDTI